MKLYLVYAPVTHWVLYIIDFDIRIPNNNHPCAVSWIHVVTYLKIRVCRVKMIHRSCFNYYEIRQTHPSKTKNWSAIKRYCSLKKAQKANNQIPIFFTLLSCLWFLLSPTWIRKQKQKWASQFMCTWLKFQSKTNYWIFQYDLYCSLLLTYITHFTFWRNIYALIYTVRIIPETW